MTAFETKDVSKANFFSLMFFVVALGNLVVYAAAGWVSNEVGQVSLLFARADGEILKLTELLAHHGSLPWGAL